jgi:hypothetical protein
MINKINSSLGSRTTFTLMFGSVINDVFVVAALLFINCHLEQLDRLILLQKG